MDACSVFAMFQGRGHFRQNVPLRYVGTCMFSILSLLDAYAHPGSKTARGNMPPSSRRESMRRPQGCGSG